MPNVIDKIKAKVVEKYPVKSIDPKDTTYLQRDFYAAESAHEQAVAAGGFRKHGANGNMVHPKSSAIAPHDKGR